MAKSKETIRGRDIAAERKTAGLRQIPVAQLAGLNLGSLVDIERERVPLSPELVETIRAAIKTLAEAEVSAR